MTDAHVPLGELEHVSDRISLMARADPEVLEVVHALLGQLWNSHPDISDTDRMLFETAVVEVLGNIIEHAYQLDSATPSAGARRFQLVMGVTPGKVIAAFGDNGQPAELDLSGAAMPGELAESGRGLPLAKAALDELTYDRVEGRNLWTLVRLRKTA